MLSAVTIYARHSHCVTRTHFGILDGRPRDFLLESIRTATTIILFVVVVFLFSNDIDIGPSGYRPQRFSHPSGRHHVTTTTTSSSTAAAAVRLSQRWTPLVGLSQYQAHITIHRSIAVAKEIIQSRDYCCCCFQFHLDGTTLW